MVPQGETVTLPAGQIGYITQALGGSFTVYVEGNLFRIAGDDADALGKEPPRPIELSLIHISEPTRPSHISRMPSSA